MLKVKCIQRIKDKQGRVQMYKLQDTQGNIKDIKAEELKKLIFGGQIEVVNFTLTKDNRLIEKKNDK